MKPLLDKLSKQENFISNEEESALDFDIIDTCAAPGNKTF